MREGWTYKKLGEVCSFINDGDWIESKDQSESGIRLIQTGNIGNGEYKDKGERAKYISEETFSKLGCTEIFMGDCLVSRLPEPIGRCCILPKLENRCITAVDCSILRFKEEIIPQLFVYYSQSSKYSIDIANKTTGTTRKRISRKNLEGIQIPLPPKSQQEAIVSELDEINSLLALKREQLQKYDKLAQSLFYEMFGDPVENEKGWKVKKIGEIGNVERGAGISKKDFVESGLPCIHYGQLHTCLGPTTRSHITCIPESLLPKYKTAQPGDVIMAITSEDVEGSCKSTAWLGKYDIVVGSDAAIFHHKQNGVYISYCTQTKAFYNEKSKYAKGFKVTHISTKEIEQIPILLPPLPLQHQFATRIEQIEEQKKQVTAAIERLETLLASRMQYWFE